MNEEDRIRSVLASVPQNATAAKVMAKGVHFEPNVKWSPGEQHWETCPPLREVPKLGLNLAGVRIGRLIVIGLHEKVSSGGARYVVRCSCGDFEVRSAKYIRDENKQKDARCGKCDYLEKIKHNYKRLGSISITEIKLMGVKS